MHVPVNKQIRYFFLLLLFCNVCTSKAHCKYYIAGAITTLLIGKLSYDYFYNYYIIPEQTIECCQSTFRTIEQDVSHYHKLYHNDAHISDWELKELILDNSDDPYPFLQYYRSLEQALFLLQKHHATITTQIAEIKKYEKKLQYKNLALQLEKNGKDLEKQISKTVSLVTILHMRVASFKEYHEDCYYWKEKMNSEKMGDA